ncbi:hypothetical protein [Salinigranum salinum]|uniref:hypothetical protein n=1 Tax=Salinigranum salinum TaxID=1364937 RepID=UPI0012606BC5|nr:hypothetical protein [Salinigranum salinum]
MDYVFDLQTPREREFLMAHWETHVIDTLFVATPEGLHFLPLEERLREEEERYIPFSHLRSVWIDRDFEYRQDTRATEDRLTSINYLTEDGSSTRYFISVPSVSALELRKDFNDLLRGLIPPDSVVRLLVERFEDTVAVAQEFHRTPDRELVTEGRILCLPTPQDGTVKLSFVSSSERTPLNWRNLHDGERSLTALPEEDVVWATELKSHAHNDDEQTKGWQPGTLVVTTHRLLFLYESEDNWLEMPLERVRSVSPEELPWSRKDSLNSIVWTPILSNIYRKERKSSITVTGEFGKKWYFSVGETIGSMKANKPVIDQLQNALSTAKRAGGRQRISRSTRQSRRGNA